jgi:hypothetical protein
MKSHLISMDKKGSPIEVNTLFYISLCVRKKRRRQSIIIRSHFIDS